jgi:putative ATPase
MMKDLGYGRGYIYDHDTPEGFAGQDFLPKEINGAVFYEPKMRGFEREMKKRIDYFSALRKNLHKKK